MKSLIIVLLLAAPAVGVESGDILFVENGHNLVERYTKSTFSHVAVAVKEGDETWVYEANPPKVIKYKLEDWLLNLAKYNSAKAHSPAILKIVRPDNPYSKSEIQCMRTYLDEQVGKKYSVRGYVRKIPSKGIHCAEISAGAIEATGRRDFSTPNYELSPGDLHGLLGKGYHQCGPSLHVTLRQKKSWCERAKDWWAKRPSWCAWSCEETLNFFP